MRELPMTTSAVKPRTPCERPYSTIRACRTPPRPAPCQMGVPHVADAVKAAPGIDVVRAGADDTFLLPHPDDGRERHLVLVVHAAQRPRPPGARAERPRVRRH